MLKIIFLVVPLAIITALFFLLFLWWFAKLRKAMFYSEVSDVRQATHIFVFGGPCKFLKFIFSERDVDHKSEGRVLGLQSPGQK